MVEPASGGAARLYDIAPVGLIPRARLNRIPRHLRLAHEYCYFLHDEGVRLLLEYEEARASVVEIKFRSRADAAAFSKRAEADDPVTALRALGYVKEAQRVVINTITLAMISDVLTHLFEALRCMERRKTVVALNLLRKPLTDSLIYLAWMLGDEDGFYTEFSAGDPDRLTHSRLGNRRLPILKAALAATGVEDYLDAEFLLSALFDPKAEGGLYRLFQHAVHLVTVQKVELRTMSENFNFIFKNPTDDDIYEGVYGVLPDVLLFLSHVILELFDRVKPMERGGRKAFEIRSTYALTLIARPEAAESARQTLAEAMDGHVFCGACEAPLILTRHNAARALLSESSRCTRCRRVQEFPFSWLF